METEILETEIDLVTRNLWAMTLGMNIARVDRTDLFKDPTSVIKSSVVISGAWNGRIELQLSQALARRITEAMFEGYKGEISKSHLEDALREIANVTGGNVKNALPAPTELSIPIVKSIASESENGGATPLVELCFTSGDEPYLVKVFRA